MSLSLHLPAGQRSYCPFGMQQLKVIAKDSEGQQHETWHTGHELPSDRIVGYERLWFRVVNGTVDALGRLLLDGTVWLEIPSVTVEVGLRDNPALKASALFIANYRCDAIVDMRGRDGRAGQQGQAGEDGGPAPDVVVDVAYVRHGFNGEKLVLLRAAPSDRAPSYYLVAADAGRFVVDVRGGRGGDAGPRSVVTSVNRVNGYASDIVYGPQPPSGNGGDGGAVLVRYPADAPELRAKVAVDNSGGGASGGGGFGRPGRPTSYQAVDIEAAFAAEINAGIRIETGDTGTKMPTTI